MIIILLRSGPDRKFYTSHPDIQFVIRYVPSFLGTVTTLAARTMYFAFNRLEFYIGMADPDPGPKLGTRFSQGKDTVARPYSEAISWSDLFNHLRGWSPRHSRYWLRLIVVANAILISFLTSFKATFLLASANPTSTDPNGWMVVVSPFSTLVLIVLYTINVTTLVSLLVHLWSRCTGLKWDPVTIADHLALFHDSNVLDDFEILEKEPDQLSRKLLADKEYRIGYWEKGKEHRLVYGIGRETHCTYGQIVRVILLTDALQLETEKTRNRRTVSILQRSSIVNQVKMKSHAQAHRTSLSAPALKNTTLPETRTPRIRTMHHGLDGSGG